MTKLGKIAATALLCVAMLPNAVSAATLLGTNVNASWNFPSLGSLYTDYGNTTVGAGTEYSNINVDGVIFYDVDIDDTSITVNWQPTSATFTSTTFNGLFITDLNNVFPALSVFSVVANGFTFLMSDVFIQGNGFGLNFQGDTFANGGSVKVNFAPSQVPVPGALPLLLAAIGGFGALKLRRKSA